MDVVSITEEGEEIIFLWVEIWAPSDKIGTKVVSNLDESEELRSSVKAGEMDECEVVGSGVPDFLMWAASEDSRSRAFVEWLCKAL